MGRAGDRRGVGAEASALAEVNGRVLGPLELAATPAARARGLLGRRALVGAMLLRPCRSVHTMGMLMPIDVAFLDGDLRVLDVLSLPPGRLTRPRWRARAVLETEAGQLARWGVRAGSALEIRTGSSPGRN